MGCGALPRLDPRWTRKGVPAPIQPRPQGFERRLVEALPLGLRGRDVGCRARRPPDGIAAGDAEGDEQMPRKGLETIRALTTGHPRRATVAGA